MVLVVAKNVQGGSIEECSDDDSQVSSQMNPATVQDLSNNAGKVPISM